MIASVISRVALATALFVIVMPTSQAAAVSARVRHACAGRLSEQLQLFRSRKCRNPPMHAGHR